MAITQAMKVEYDEDRLSIEEQNELEEFCVFLLNLFDEKIQRMGLHIIEGGYSDYVTRLTKEELENAISIEEYKVSKIR